MSASVNVYVKTRIGVSAYGDEEKAHKESFLMTLVQFSMVSNHQCSMREAFVCFEPATGIEPALSAWEADVLPLNYVGIC